MKLIRSLIILVFTTPALTKNILIERQIEKRNNFNVFLKTQTSSLSTPLGTSTSLGTSTPLGTGTPITSIPTFPQSTSTKTFFFLNQHIHLLQTWLILNQHQQFQHL